MLDRPNSTDVRDALRHVGFSLVETESSRLHRKGESRPDVVAWAANASGDLKPWAVVEIKTGRAKTPDMALPALIRTRSLLETVDHYAVINGQWFKADAGLIRMHPVAGPDAPRFGGEGVIGDIDLAVQLIFQEVWRRADFGRGVSDDNPLLAFERGLREVDSQRAIAPRIHFAATWKALERYLAVADDRWVVQTKPAVARAMAALTGSKLRGRVLDPFCGSGALLWSSIARAQDAHLDLESAEGADFDDAQVAVASYVARHSPVPTLIHTMDAFANSDGGDRRHLLPSSPAGQFETAPSVVIAQPPFGVRLPDRWELLSGQYTNDMDAAAVDVALRNIPAGGRAVLQLPLGFVSKGGIFDVYRRFLTSNFRVGAVLGLPPGGVASTNVRSVLVVIDRAAPTETFVANLGRDWEIQLDPASPMMVAALRHLDEDQR